MLALIMIVSIWYFNFVMHRLVGEKHQILEYILETGEIPVKWSYRFDKKIKKLMSDPRNKDKVLDIQRNANRYYSYKFNQLTEYLKRTNLVEDNYLRKELLDKLGSIRNSVLNVKKYSN